MKKLLPRHVEIIEKIDEQVIVFLICMLLLLQFLYLC
jgi:hypothetical protein